MKKYKAHWDKRKYGDWYKYDKRSKWNRHWAGKHQYFDCFVYSLAELGYICKETGVYMQYGDKDKLKITTYL